MELLHYSNQLIGKLEPHRQLFTELFFSLIESLSFGIPAFHNFNVTGSHVRLHCRPSNDIGCPVPKRNVGQLPMPLAPVVAAVLGKELDDAGVAEVGRPKALVPREDCRVSEDDIAGAVEGALEVTQDVLATRVVVGEVGQRLHHVAVLAWEHVARVGVELGVGVDERLHQGTPMMGVAERDWLIDLDQGAQLEHIRIQEYALHYCS